MEGAQGQPSTACGGSADSKKSGTKSALQIAGHEIANAAGVSRNLRGDAGNGQSLVQKEENAGALTDAREDRRILADQLREDTLLI